MKKPPSSFFFSTQAMFVWLGVVLVSATLTFASDPPWKGKPYNQWDDNDLELVFTASPWTRKAEVMRTWDRFSAKDNQQNDQIGGRGRGIPGDDERSTRNSTVDDVDFFVDWASSRPMRAAAARKAVLHGGQPDLDVEKYAKEPQTEYQIIVQANDMTPFTRHDGQFFQQKAFLEIKKKNLKLSPSHVVYERDDKGVSSAIFFFPKTTGSGDPTISGDEKSVTFACKIEESQLRVTFEPQKMLDSSGPTL